MLVLWVSTLCICTFYALKIFPIYLFFYQNITFYLLIKTGRYFLFIIMRIYFSTSEIMSCMYFFSIEKKKRNSYEKIQVIQNKIAYPLLLTYFSSSKYIKVLEAEKNSKMKKVIHIPLFFILRKEYIFFKGFLFV